MASTIADARLVLSLAMSLRLLAGGSTNTQRHARDRISAASSAHGHANTGDLTQRSMDNMNPPRGMCTAILLSDGSVLVVSGVNQTALASAELYDPGMCTWRYSDTLSISRLEHAAIALTDGTVLVVGNENHQAPALAEGYAPVGETWRAAGVMHARRMNPALAVASGSFDTHIGFCGDHPHPSIRLRPTQGA